MTEPRTAPVWNPVAAVPGCIIGPDAITIQVVSVSGQTFDIGTRKHKDAIGWGATLSNCELRLFDGSNVIVYNAAFEDCRFVAMRAQEDIRWRNVRFSRCTFEGLYRDSCQFGFKNSSDLTYPPKMEECDFSKAQLDWCVFGPIDLASIRWPDSPHVIFFHPASHREVIESLVPEWPMYGFLKSNADCTDEYFANVISLPYLQKQKYPTEQLNQFLDKCRALDFVRINF